MAQLGSNPAIAIDLELVANRHHGRNGRSLRQPDDRPKPDLADRLHAKFIIEFAKEGERDPNRLRELVLKTLRPE